MFYLLINIHNTIVLLQTLGTET